MIFSTIWFCRFSVSFKLVQCIMALTCFCLLPILTIILDLCYTLSKLVNIFMWFIWFSLSFHVHYKWIYPNYILHRGFARKLYDTPWMELLFPPETELQQLMQTQPPKNPPPTPTPPPKKRYTLNSRKCAYKHFALSFV